LGIVIIGGAIAAQSHNQTAPPVARAPAPTPAPAGNLFSPGAAPWPTSGFQPSAPEAAPLATDLAQLNASVRDMVQRARGNELLAMTAAAKARNAAAEGNNAALRARAGESGYIVQHDRGGSLFEGQQQGGKPFGYGAASFASGYHYSGMWGFDRIEGLGVYTYRGDSIVNRYEGEVSGNGPSGMGAVHLNDGSVLRGSVLGPNTNGAGAFDMPNGDRFEGEFNLTDGINGLGARWGADGALLEQGIWTRGVLTTALIP